MQSQNNKRADTKHWYQSKTIWFNTIIGTLALTVSYLEPFTPALEQFMAPENFGILMAAVNLTNAILRKNTTQAIKGGQRE